MLGTQQGASSKELWKQYRTKFNDFYHNNQELGDKVLLDTIKDILIKIDEDILENRNFNPRISQLLLLEKDHYYKNPSYGFSKEDIKNIRNLIPFIKILNDITKAEFKKPIKIEDTKKESRKLPNEPTDREKEYQQNATFRRFYS